MADSGKPAKREDLPPLLVEEATRWMARLREPLADPSDSAERQAAFESWLESDRRHWRSFEEAERLWAALEAPVAELLEDEPALGRRRARPRWRLRAAVLAASLAIVLAAGFGLRDEASDLLFADHATAIGARASLALADSSRVTLNSDSAIALDFEDGRRGVRLLRGEAWFEVAKDLSRPFVVETPVGSIAVTGTSFDVRLEDAGAVVSLAEGAVRLAPGKTAPGKVSEALGLLLEPGEQSLLTDGGATTPQPFEPNQVSAWLRGQIVFFDSPLGEVVAELNRYRRGRIVIADSALRRLKVSGVFSSDDPDAALQVITDTLKLEVTSLTDFLLLLH